METIEVNKELFEAMKKHIVDQYQNDNNPVGFSKGYNERILQSERKKLINKLLE